MRFLLAIALMVAVVGCAAEAPKETKEMAAPKIKKGPQASGMALEAEGH